MRLIRLAFLQQKNDPALVCCGRPITHQEIKQIQETVSVFSNLSRKELSQTICEHLNWRTAAGANKIDACIKMLEKLEDIKALQLPAKRAIKKPKKTKVLITSRTDPQPAIAGNAGDLNNVNLEIVTAEEHDFSNKAVHSALHFVKENIDLNSLYHEICKEEYLIDTADAPTNFSGQPEAVPAFENSNHDGMQKITIGIIRDSAFQFYYPDNIDALKKAGADIIYISPLKDSSIPEVHGIYMGGGFPETHAYQLSQNKTFRDELKKLSQKGLPIYAECGGLIFLGESLLLEEKEYPMTGVFPIKFGLCKRPQGHGYTEVEIVNDNPFFDKRKIVKGHEFRYSNILSINYKDHEMAFKMTRGRGIIDRRDGYVLNNTLGTYTHIHALGTPSWAPSFVQSAIAFQETSL